LRPGKSWRRVCSARASSKFGIKRSSDLNLREFDVLVQKSLEVGPTWKCPVAHHRKGLKAPSGVLNRQACKTSLQRRYDAGGVIDGFELAVEIQGR
jgi:hypothetical protein